jgi:hypothetical protein
MSHSSSFSLFLNWPPTTFDLSGPAAIQPVARVADNSYIMARFTPLHRRSRTKFPPQHCRSADVFTDPLTGEPAPRGGGGGASAPVALRQWRQSMPRREIRGVAVCGRIVPRLCTVV